MSMPKITLRTLATVGIICLPLTGCDKSDEDDGPTGACVESSYGVTSAGSSYDESCSDEVTQDDCDSGEFTDGTYDVSTIFYEDQSCSEVGH